MSSDLEKTEVSELLSCPYPCCNVRFDENAHDPRTREILACIHMWSWHGVPMWPGTWTGRWSRL